MERVVQLTIVVRASVSNQDPSFPYLQDETKKLLKYVLPSLGLGRNLTFSSRRTLETIETDVLKLKDPADPHGVFQRAKAFIKAPDITKDIQKCNKKLDREMERFKVRCTLGCVVDL